MKHFIFSLFTGFLFANSAMAADLTFSWLPNTQSILAGYMIHSGTISKTYTEHIDVKKPAIVDGVVKYTINKQEPGIRYYACTAYATDGLNSAYSNEIVVNIPLDAPGDFVISGASITYSFIPKP